MVASGNSVGRVPEYFALFLKIRLHCSDIPVESQNMKKPFTKTMYFLEVNKIGNLTDLKFLGLKFMNLQYL